MKKMLVLVFLPMLAGCAAFQDKPPAGFDVARLVSLDFVNVMQQIDRLPAATSILKLRHLKTAGNPFAGAFEDALQKAGYATRTAGAGPTDFQVNYTIDRKITRDDSGNVRPVFTYTVSVGDVVMRRSYTTADNGLVTPVATMQVKGSDTGNLQLDDSIF